MSSEPESESFTDDTSKDNHSPGVEMYIKLGNVFKLYSLR